MSVSTAASIFFGIVIEIFDSSRTVCMLNVSFGQVDLKIVRVRPRRIGFYSKNRRLYSRFRFVPNVVWYGHSIVIVIEVCETPCVFKSKSDRQTGSANGLSRTSVSRRMFSAFLLLYKQE